jgi:hypothetical protein
MAEEIEDSIKRWGELAATVAKQIQTELATIITKRVGKYDIVVGPIKTIANVTMFFSLDEKRGILRPARNSVDGTIKIEAGGEFSTVIEKVTEDKS